MYYILNKKIWQKFSQFFVYFVIPEHKDHYMKN